MYVAKVVGNAWGTRKHPSLEGARLLLVQPLDLGTLKARGEPVLALDRALSAGPGSVVLVVDEGNSARQILEDPKAPVRTVVCGIVDEAAMNGKTIKF